VISTLREGGVSEGQYASFNLGDHVGDNAERVAENRQRLSRAALLPAKPNWLQQVHGVAVADLDQPDLAQPADAAMTRQVGRVCAILTADCLPVMLAAVSGEAVAAAHAGWRGLAGGVLESTMKALGLPGEQVQAWLGPAIGVAHFEVGAEVREVFLVGNDAAEAAFQPNARGRFMADLALLARLRLERLGVRRIFGGTQCTYDDPQRFFSHRRDGTTGRQATLIWRESVKNR
jgi:polyphenol oxidase